MRWGGPFYTALVNACRGVGNQNFAKATFLEAMKSVKKTDSHTEFLLQAEYGKFLLRELKKPKQAARIFERILDGAKASRKDSGSSLAKVNVVDLLCDIYLARALQGGKDSKEAGVNMEKLDMIWTRLRSHSSSLTDSPSEDWFEGDVFWTTQNSTLFLAALYRVFEQPEKSRRLLKEHLRLSLDLLTDDDLENDWQGYLKLADTLARASDNTNALAAYTLVTPKWIPEDAASVPKASGGGPLPVGSASRWFICCDGECGTYAEYGAEEFYTCISCVDKAFCRDCHKLLMEGSMEINICGKDHGFLFVPTVEPFKKGTVPVGKVFMDEKEWLAKLRQEWGF